jgi:hypothetical protein
VNLVRRYAWVPISIGGYIVYRWVRRYPSHDCAPALLRQRGGAFSSVPSTHDCSICP